MRIPTDEELHDYIHAIAIGGLKGAAVGLFATAGVGYFAVRRYPSLKSRGAFFTSFSLVGPTLIAGITNMEWASRKFEAQRYHIFEGSPDQVALQKKIDNLSLYQRALHYGAENKYKIIMGSWAASLAGSFWYVNRDKYMTKAQKAVQARMYAQGLTVFLLLASMAVTYSYGSDPAHVEDTEDESWKKIVREEELRMQREQQQKNNNKVVQQQQGAAN